MNEVEEHEDSRVIVKVVGIGSSGINHLEAIKVELIFAIEFIAADFDICTLNRSSAHTKILLGMETKEPETGANHKNSNAVTEEAIKDIEDVLKGADVIILVAGIDELNSTVAIQLIADIAKKSSTIIVGIVSTCSSLEVEKQKDGSLKDLRSLCKHFDSLVVIRDGAQTGISTLTTNISHDYKVLNALFVDAVGGITNSIIQKGFMALDCTDLKTVLPSDTPVTFGTGMALGNDRALVALQKALQPLSIGGIDIGQASGILVNITGSADMTMDDYNAVNRVIHEKAHEDANIKIAVSRDDYMEQTIKVTTYLSQKIR